jgi:UDP-glucose 4-epimerase
MPIRAIVTGGAGFIGSHVADGLLARGDEVTVLDNLASGKRERVPAGARLAEVDVRDRAAVDALFAEVRPQAIFHLAAQADVRVSVADPVFDGDVNVLGTIAVLEAARAHDAQVVFSSTGGAIYGEVDTIPSDESTAPAPMAPYGVSKFCAEQYLLLSNRLYGTRHLVLRYGNVFGPRQDPHGEAGVVAIFFGKLLEGQAPTIFGDGSQTRDYVAVADVVRANLGALEYLGPETIFNIGTQIETSVTDLYAAIQAAAGTSIDPIQGEARLGELDRSCLDCTRAAAELHWQPTVSLAAGLDATLDSLRA